MATVCLQHMCATFAHSNNDWLLSQVTACKQDHHVFGTASADHTARLWSTQTGDSFYVYDGHNGAVNSVRFSPETGTTACTAGGDGEVHVWEFFRPEAHAGGDAGGSATGTGAGDAAGTAHASQLGPAAARLRLRGHGGPVHAADWMPGGGKIVSGALPAQRSRETYAPPFSWLQTFPDVVEG